MKSAKLLFIVVLTSVYSNGFTIAAAAGLHVDSLLPVSIDRSFRVLDGNAIADLADIESSYKFNRNHRETMARLLELLGPGVNLFTRKVRLRLFGDLAKVSARLRLYPLTMRCYYNVCKDEVDLPQDSGYYQVNPVIESAPTRPGSIAAAYDDGRNAAFYAVLLEVKQPIPGKRKAFRYPNVVGHTFITLIKYNTDGSIVCKCFGFYPRKTGLLSATPFRPSAPSVFRDDSRHEWDEAAGRILSARQFEAILDVLRSYDGKRYNLNHRNCTDFGLEAAQAGGIRVWGALGKWPLGRGNNPGAAGQSLLRGKLVNLGTDPSGGLLLVDNLPAPR